MLCDACAVHAAPPVLVATMVPPAPAAHPWARRRTATARRSLRRPRFCGAHVAAVARGDDGAAGADGPPVRVPLQATPERSCVCPTSAAATSCRRRRADDVPPARRPMPCSRRCTRRRRGRLRPARRSARPSSRRHRWWRRSRRPHPPPTRASRRQSDRVKALRVPASSAPPGAAPSSEVRIVPFAPTAHRWAPRDARPERSRCVPEAWACQPPAAGRARQDQEQGEREERRRRSQYGASDPAVVHHVDLFR